MWPNLKYIGSISAGIATALLFDVIETVLFADFFVLITFADHATRLACHIPLLYVVAECIYRFLPNTRNVDDA